MKLMNFIASISLLSTVASVATASRSEQPCNRWLRMRMRAAGSAHKASAAVRRVVSHAIASGAFQYISPATVASRKSPTMAQLVVQIGAGGILRGGAAAPLRRLTSTAAARPCSASCACDQLWERGRHEPGAPSRRSVYERSTDGFTKRA
jgi:hypothetical protein